MAPAKAADALLTIGEVATKTGIPQHVLRYWEGRLPQLQPVKRAGGRRYYRPEDVALLRQVQQLIDREGYTLDGAARAMRRRAIAVDAEQDNGESRPALPLAADPAAIDTSTITALRAMRERLARALG